MDRTAWIVVTICVIGLIWQFTKPPAPRPQQPPQTENQPGNTGDPNGEPNGGTNTGENNPGGTDQNPTTPPQPVIEEKIQVLRTPEVEFTMTNKGGGIKNAKVLGSTDQFVLNQNGLSAIGAIHDDAGIADVSMYNVKEYTDSSITYTKQLSEGITLEKKYSLAGEDQAGAEKGGRDFLLNLEVKFINTSSQVHQDRYFMYTGAASPVSTDEIDMYRAFFWNDGGEVDYEAVSYFSSGLFSDAKSEFSQSFENFRWGGVMNQFYTTIISTEGDGVEGGMWARRTQVEVPLADESGGSKNMYVVHAGIGLPAMNLEVGKPITYTYEIYTGPKEYRRLVNMGQERREVMFYGWFSIVSRTLMNALTWVRSWFPETGWGWGWAVLIVTIMLRTLMWPLHAKSTKMSKKMGLLAPKMKEMKEKYKDNPQKMNQEMMKMYREYGVNPIGGCLPMLVQIPIFFGFYRMLQYAAELRGEQWLWVKDLSAPDTVGHVLGFPINPLPILMTLTMFLQMSMMPKTGDKMQRRIFMLMPFLFLWFCYSFASALPLYWTAQNIFGIAQTWLMRKIGGEVKLEKRELPTRTPPTMPGQKAKKAKKQVTRTGGKAKSAGKKKRSGR